MRFSRRRLLGVGLGSAVLPFVSNNVHSQTYPTRYVRLVVPFPPGGGGDALARPLANRLSEMWGQQLVVENKPGAGGNVGAQAVAQAAPDGYTLLLGAAFLAITPTLYPSAGYDPIRDLAPITLVTTIPNLMMVPNSSPAKSVREFIDYAKANPGKVTFASTGIGASPHLSGELLKHQAGIDMTHIPYRGAGPAMNDLIPGRVDLMFSNLPGVLPQVQSGTVRGLAVTSATRSQAFPEIPTIGETLQGYEVDILVGFVRTGEDTHRNYRQASRRHSRGVTASIRTAAFCRGGCSGQNVYSVRTCGPIDIRYQEVGADHSRGEYQAGVSMLIILSKMIPTIEVGSPSTKRAPEARFEYV